MKPKFLILPLLFLAIIAAIVSPRINLPGKNISINISEDKNELMISADFPKAKSGMVHDYLKSQLNLSNLTDFDYLEIREYETPDGLMNFYIKSREGYFKILMDRNKNTVEARDKLKETVEGVKKLLAN